MRTTTPIPSCPVPHPRRSGRLVPALATVLSVAGLYTGAAAAADTAPDAAGGSDVPATTVVPGTAQTTVPEPVGQFWLLPDHGPAGAYLAVSGSCGWGGDHVVAELWIGAAATSPIDTETMDMLPSQIFFNPDFRLPLDLLPGEHVRVHVSCSSGFEGDRAFTVDEYFRITPPSGPRTAPIHVHGACTGTTVATLVIGSKDGGRNDRSLLVSATPTFDAELFVPPDLPVADEVWIRATCDDRPLPPRRYDVESGGQPCDTPVVTPMAVAVAPAVVEPSFTG